MDDAEQQFVIAPSSGARSRLPDDWQEALCALPGVRRIGGHRQRLQVGASGDIAATIGERFGDALRIEVVKSRRPAARPG